MMRSLISVVPAGAVPVTVMRVQPVDETVVDVPVVCPMNVPPVTNEYHCRINGKYDYYPSTGLFTWDKGKKSARGFNSLLRILEKDKAKRKELKNVRC